MTKRNHVPVKVKAIKKKTPPKVEIKPIQTKIVTIPPPAPPKAKAPFEVDVKVDTNALDKIKKFLFEPIKK